MHPADIRLLLKSPDICVAVALLYGCLPGSRSSEDVRSSGPEILIAVEKGRYGGMCSRTWSSPRMMLRYLAASTSSQTVRQIERRGVPSAKRTDSQDPSCRRAVCKLALMMSVEYDSRPLEGRVLRNSRFRKTASFLKMSSISFSISKRQFPAASEILKLVESGKRGGALPSDLLFHSAARNECPGTG